MTARFVEQRTVDPADLDPYPGNPNVGDVDLTAIPDMDTAHDDRLETVSP